ncbi:hypothetical protein FRC12_008566 [Ceratobasidium sp. 428]|nr:hypothetical protein FRC12_008566 [Ceratobasidium sp. 428]
MSSRWSSTNDTPAVLYRLVAGTPLLRMDLIDAGTNVTTNQRRSIIETRELKRPKHTEPHARVSKRGVWDWLIPSVTGVKSKTATVVPSSFDLVSTLGVLYIANYDTRNSAAPTAEDNGYSTQVVDKSCLGLRGLRRMEVRRRTMRFGRARRL